EGRLYEVYSLAVSPDWRRLALGSNTRSASEKEPPSLLGIMNFDGIGKMETYNTAGPVSAIAFSPDGPYVVAPSPPNPGWELAVVDSATGRRVATIPLGEGWVNGLRFSPDGRTLAVSFGRHEVRLIETATWRLRALIPSLGGQAGFYFGTDRYRDAI